MNKYVKLRREFHHYPELGWREIRTCARIAEELTNAGYKCYMGKDALDFDTIGFELLTPEEREAEMKRAIEEGAKEEFVRQTEGISGVVVELDTGVPGPVTALRVDIDCLPYDEPQTPGFRPFDEGYISCHAERVHACGHDAHTAIGIGLAETLMGLKDQLTGKIRVFFQPAEEKYNGALAIIAKGWMKDVKNFISIHMALSDAVNHNPLPSHTFACGCKDFLSDCQIEVEITGYAAHPCGAAQEGKNALLAACSAALNLHTIANHEQGLTRVNVGRISGGVACNTIAPNAYLDIEYRGQNREISAYVRKRVFEILDGACKMHDCTYTYTDYGEVPGGQSSDSIMEVIQRAADKEPWFEKVYFEGSVGGTDDAVCYINEVQDNGGQGTYIGIGTDTTKVLHNPEFDLDEDCIQPTINVLVNAVIELNGK